MGKIHGCRSLDARVRVTGCTGVGICKLGIFWCTGAGFKVSCALRLPCIISYRPARDDSSVVCTSNFRGLSSGRQCRLWDQSCGLRWDQWVAVAPVVSAGFSTFEPGPLGVVGGCTSVPPGVVFSAFLFSVFRFFCFSGFCFQCFLHSSVFGVCYCSSLPYLLRCFSSLPLSLPCPLPILSSGILLSL